jgi:hypothetical protein
MISILLYLYLGFYCGYLEDYHVPLGFSVLFFSYTFKLSYFYESK